MHMKKKQLPQSQCIFVCMGGSCRHGGSKKLRKKLEHLIADEGLDKAVRVTGMTCMDECGKGPNVLVYPPGLWLRGLDTENLHQVLECIQASTKHGQNAAPSDATDESEE